MINPYKIIIEIELKFGFDGLIEHSFAYLDDKLGDLKNHTITVDKNIDVYFLYNGEVRYENDKIEEIISKDDKERGKMRVVIIRKDNFVKPDELEIKQYQTNSSQPKDPFKIIIVSEFKGKRIYLQTNSKDTFKNIKTKILNKFQLGVEAKFSYLMGVPDEEKKLGEIINGCDREDCIMEISVNENEVEDPNSKKQIKVTFDFNQFKEELVANLEDKLGDLKNKLTIIDKNIDVYSIYSGNITKDDDKIGEIIKRYDKKNGKMYIMLLELHNTDVPNMLEMKQSPTNSFQPKAPSQIKLFAEFKGNKIFVQANLKDTFKNIKKKILQKLEILGVETWFIYGGNVIDEEKKLEEIISKIDLEACTMNILVDANEVEDPNSKKIEVGINFKGKAYSIQAELNYSFQKVKDEFLKKLGKDIYFLYKGEKIKEDDKELKAIMQPLDLESGKMMIVADE